MNLQEGERHIVGPGPDKGIFPDTPAMAGAETLEQLRYT
jgi:hypothetical protein